MPVHLYPGQSGHSNGDLAGSKGRRLHIGLINNMPDGALEATERQFVKLLDSVAGAVDVCLSLYALPEVPRTEVGRRRIRRFYSGIESLWDSQLDGLIVTGTEPRTANLQDEPYWGTFAKVVDWAENNTLSTVWSCLAAHAAILHTDGIVRRRLTAKLFGIFECAQVSDHPLTSGASSNLRMPHSRWNDIPEDKLTDCGYQLLIHSRDAGIDVFAKQRNSLFVFFQGHPEYEANTLLLEYRREVGRYLKGERETYPLMPSGYFDCETADALTTVQDRLQSMRNDASLADFPTALIEPKVSNTWQSLGACVYSNWLSYLCAQKGFGVAQEEPALNRSACAAD
jgi:homoserine O-succinyltransferase/O-acetyltransferase